MNRRILTVVAALVGAAAVAAPAPASQFIARNASDVSLKVNRKGMALVTYRAGGSWHRVLAWGAINALPPNGSRPQVSFRLDYSGGWGTFRKLVWKNFSNACRPYDGPKLAWFVTGCKASDGSYWALQSWQVDLPDLGFLPWLPKQRVWRLNLSHWSGPVAKIDGYTDWVYNGRFHDLFGRLTYRGQAVHGFRTTRYGAPLDKYGRLLYLDTYNSAYGSGWRRENSFVAHNPNGNFCYGFYRFDPLKGGYAHPPGYNAGRRPSGHGERYRISAHGPGVTPDVMWQGKGLPDFDRGNAELVLLEQQMNALNDRLAGSDRLCQHH